MTLKEGEQAGDARWRHAEYKVPGGKLLVVDLLIQEARLHQVRLSGDFFLEPPETLDRINAALEGLPVNSQPDALERAVQAVVQDDVMMYGITTEGIAIVIQRALQ